VSKPRIPRLANQVLDEASAWFVEFAAGQVDKAAREEFVRWLRTSPEHVRAYLHISAHWEDSRALDKFHRKSVDELVRIASQVSANVVRLESAAEGVVEPAGNVPRPRTRQNVLTVALAAALATVIVAASTWYYTQRNLYSTGVGELRSIRLADGSTVELNALSRVRVRMGDRQRDIELLAGQALFKVAKDEDRPFVVSSDSTRIRAVGTQFDVYRKRAELIVTVLEGRVAVTAAERIPDSGRDPVSGARESSEALESGSRATRGLRASGSSTGSMPGPEDSRSMNREVLLISGEQLAVTATGSEKPSDADIAAITAWTQKQIVFKSTPLAEVAEEFNRYNRRRLVITDPAVATIRISGNFASTDPASLLRGLNDLGAFTITEMDDRIEISGK
jgi:transmembrane sensor